MKADAKEFRRLVIRNGDADCGPSISRQPGVGTADPAGPSGVGQDPPATTRYRGHVWDSPSGIPTDSKKRR